MKTFCALIAVGVGVAFGTPPHASAQPPAASVPSSAPVIDTSNQGTVVYNGGQVIPYQSYSVPCQPVYYTRYYYPAQYSSVYYTQPTYYYSQPTCYYSQPTCYYTSRRSHWFCR